MRTALALLLLCLPAARAAAAGPAEGRPTAAAEADLRAPGAELVEVEGFTGPDGDIPCKGGSFSNAWHYKFRDPSSGDWLIVNACADNFLNAAKHFPYMKADEPDKKLPYSFAAPAAVLKKLAADGAFTPVPNPLSRDVRMHLRVFPALAGRPAGCYWEVSQGKARAYADCAAGKTWKAGGPAAGPKLTPKKLKGGGETVGRSLQKAFAAARAKSQGAELMMVEAIPLTSGALDCVACTGWTFIFRMRELASYGTVSSGCGTTSKLDLGDFTGKYSNLREMQPIPDHFKDSDEAASVVPEKCAHKRVVMKLFNYKPAKTPVTGHTFVWEVYCGTRKYFVDAATGDYLGKER